MNFMDLIIKEKKSRENYNKQGLFINREVSWLDFNKRVLREATREKNPLLERLKFLAITGSNLDEFIMVRFSSVLNKCINTPSGIDISGKNPGDEYKIVLDELSQFYDAQNSTYEVLANKLAVLGHTIVHVDDITDDEMDECRKIFNKQIYPTTSPISLDTTKEFPLITSKSLNMVVEVESSDKDVLSVIPIHESLPRYYNVGIDSNRYVSIEDIIYMNIHKIFMNKIVKSVSSFRIFRANYLTVERDADKLLFDRMVTNVRQRETGSPIFMEVKRGISKKVLKLLLKTFDVAKKHIKKVDNIYIANLSNSGIDIDDTSLKFSKFTGKYPSEIERSNNIFNIIAERDLVLHHPYDSYKPVIDFITQASTDDNVIAIRQSLYRVSSEDSPIINALCTAAKKGKYVAVLLELKARFDEIQNMELVKKLSDAGCHITFGVENLKIHAKFLSVVRREKKVIKTYTHLGTGNYNDVTAKFYTDISYITSDKDIGEDIITLFNLLSGCSEPKDEIEAFYYSPYNIRYMFHQLVDREIKNASKGRSARIILKVNSISDKDIINQLYDASSKGVQIIIIARGICSMKPINDNIIIKSVIGRFLEHSRIFCFDNDGESEVFISSADLLTRNLDRRVELMTKIVDEESAYKITKILSNYLKVSIDSHYMNPEGNYSIFTSKFDIQNDFISQAEKMRPLIAIKK